MQASSSHCCSLCDQQEIAEISSVAKAAHREVVQYRDLLLLQKVFISLLFHIVQSRLLIVKVETISEAQRTGWNLAASNLSDAAQVHHTNCHHAIIWQIACSWQPQVVSSYLMLSAGQSPGVSPHTKRLPNDLKLLPAISCYAGPGGALGQPARPCHEADWTQASGLRLSGGKPSCFTTLL